MHVATAVAVFPRKFHSSRSTTEGRPSIRAVAQVRRALIRVMPDESKTPDDYA